MEIINLILFVIVFGVLGFGCFAFAYVVWMDIKDWIRKRS